MNGNAFFCGICSRARSAARIDVRRRVAMMRSTALVPKPGTRNSSCAAGGGDIERKAVAVAQRPGEFRIDVERQHAGGLVDDLVRVETVEAHQPVGLVEPVLAQ